MAIWLVTNPARRTSKGGNAMIVSATDATGALEAAGARFAGDSTFVGATATQLSDVVVTAANALLGWRFRVVVSNPTTNAIIADVIVTGTASDDTLDEIGVLLRDALNATAPISNATYTAGTQTLVVAAGGSDALGNMDVDVIVMAPIVNSGGSQRENSDRNHTVFVASVTDRGIAAADLTVVFAADTLIVPRVLNVINAP